MSVTGPVSRAGENNQGLVSPAGAAFSAAGVAFSDGALLTVVSLLDWGCGLRDGGTVTCEADGLGVAVADGRAVGLADPGADTRGDGDGRCDAGGGCCCRWVGTAEGTTRGALAGADGAVVGVSGAFTSVTPRLPDTAKKAAIADAASALATVDAASTRRGLRSCDHTLSGSWRGSGGVGRSAGRASKPAGTGLKTTVAAGSNGTVAAGSNGTVAPGSNGAVAPGVKAAVASGVKRAVVSGSKPTGALAPSKPIGRAVPPNPVGMRPARRPERPSPAASAPSLGPVPAFARWPRSYRTDRHAPRTSRRSLSQGFTSLSLSVPFAGSWPASGSACSADYAGSLDLHPTGVAG